jgi:hypothetical protein
MPGEWLIPPLALLAVMTVSGQGSGQPTRSANEQAPVFSSAAELVVVHVTVTDRLGALVTGLSHDALRIGPARAAFGRRRVSARATFFVFRLRGSRRPSSAAPSHSTPLAG